jgi:hypothetical protein
MGLSSGPEAVERLESDAGRLQISRDLLHHRGQVDAVDPGPRSLAPTLADVPQTNLVGLNLIELRP